jgi:hypothetical protein
MFFLSSSTFAQDVEEISDEQLWKYALLEEVIDQMKKDISIELNQYIKSQEGMTGQRYKELDNAKGDEGKLAAIEAKDWEIQFMANIDEMKSDRIASIKSVNSDLATKMVGDRGKIYKSIKEQLKSDSALADRYKVIRESIQLDTAKAD